MSVSRKSLPGRLGGRGSTFRVGRVGGESRPRDGSLSAESWDFLFDRSTGREYNGVVYLIKTMQWYVRLGNRAGSGIVRVTAGGGNGHEQAESGPARADGCVCS